MVEEKVSKGHGIFYIVTGFILVIAVLWYMAEDTSNEENGLLLENQEIRVGYLPIYVDLPLFVAVEEGLFTKRGLNVSLQRFESSPDMGTALVVGQIDAIASIATPTALNIEDRDPGRFKIFMVDQATIENPLSSLILPAGSTVNSIQDLRGKTVASFPGPTATTLSPLAFQSDGLSASEFELIDIPPANHLEVLNSGTIDALVTYEPTATQAELRNGATRLVRGFIESKLMNPWPAGSWLYSSANLETEEQEMRSVLFFDAIFEATDMLRNDPDSLKSHLSKYTLIDEEVAIDAPNIEFTKSIEADSESLQGYSDLLFREGYISKRVLTDKLLIRATGSP